MCCSDEDVDYDGRLGSLAMTIGLNFQNKALPILGSVLIPFAILNGANRNEESERSDKPTPQILPCRSE